MYRVKRFAENPIIHPDMDPDIGTNLNGPSLIRVPDWVPDPLGQYYLYFAHHQGAYIRMAYANNVHGPWTIHRDGVLALEATCCKHHIASPDVHVSHEKNQIIMYFHGVMPGSQRSFRAMSRDGLNFDADAVDLGPFYFRVFQYNDAWYAIAKTVDAPGGGVLLRSHDGIATFEQGPDILHNQRHVALRKRGDLLEIFYTRGEDCPERILLSTMSLAGSWLDWRPTDPIEIMRPEEDYEGGHLPQRPSQFGAIHEPVCEIRDPAILEDGDKLFLLYTGAGETVICAAELLPTETE